MVGYNHQGSRTLIEKRDPVDSYKVPVYFKLPFLSSRGVGLGWRSDNNIPLPPMWPGFKSRRRRHLWVEFVVGLLLCSENFFAGYTISPLSSKTNICKFQFRRGSLAEETLCACATFKSLFTYVSICVSVFVCFSFCGSFKTHKMQTFM